MLELREITTISIFVRILAAMVLGGLIGMERGIKNRPAGFRTYMLVCIGACIVMIVNQYVYQVFGTGDPVRMGAQVVSGIGFLGAGTIIVTSHNQIKGLTTAAGLWASACVGLASGIGLYEAAVAGSLAIFATLTILHTLDVRLRSQSNVVELYIELDPGTSLGLFLCGARERGLELSSILKQYEGGNDGDSLAFIVTVRGRKNMRHTDIVQSVRRLEGIRYLETL
jgi:putative Mg2+ transporter-C (MgtC) family protein